MTPHRGVGRTFEVHGPAVIGAQSVHTIVKYIYSEFTEKVVWPKPDQPDRLLHLCHTHVATCYA